MPGARDDTVRGMAELLIPRLVERLASARFQPVPLPPADWTGEIVRPDDLLHLVVSAYNLRPAFGPTGPAPGRSPRPR